MTTLLYEDRQTELPAAAAEGPSLWLSADEIARATGWAWKPEGLCREDTCIPIPAGDGWRRAAGGTARLDLARLWRHMDQPVAATDDGSAWVLGTGARARADALASLQAPDFDLPDLTGRRVRLKDHRGRRVCLVSWASW